MESFDLGVSLAFWLTIAGAVLCIYYGTVNWNKGADNQVDKNVEQWAHDENKIDEEL